jgi:hypothetical protein
LFGLSQILKALIGRIQVELAHLMRFERDFEMVHDLNELVHA